MVYGSMPLVRQLTIPTFVGEVSLLENFVSFIKHPTSPTSHFSDNTVFLIRTMFIRIARVKMAKNPQFPVTTKIFIQLYI